MSNTLLMTDQDRERWTGPLSEYYRNKGLSEDKIRQSINTIFAEVQYGWNRAPRDLDTRIKMKSGYQWKSHENLKPKRKSETTASVMAEMEDEGDMFSTLSKKEEDWWEDRVNTYKKDFDFNVSSDKPLLEQLLVEELIQNRLFRAQLKYKDRDFSKRLSDSLKRISDIQTKLGITREQRAGVLNKIDGNVAQIAFDLDQKLKDMPETIKKEYEEEIYYSSLKNQRPTVNILPPIEKVEALLNVGGKISANLDSTRISEITEEVAKEITDIREDLKKPPKIELPGGIDLS